MTSLKQTLSHIILGQKGGETRAQIIELLKQRACNLNQIAKFLNLNYRTIKHHIKVLEEQGLITPSRVSKYGEVYFLSELLEQNYDEFVKLTEKMRNLSSSPKFYQTVIEKTSDAIIVVDIDGDVLFMNPGAEKLYGYTMAEIVGTELGVFRSKKVLDAIRGRGKSKFLQQETMAYTKQGQLIYVWLTVDGIVDDSGDTIAYIILSRDVTAQKKATEEIERLASFLSLSPNPVFEVGRDGKVTYFNEGTLKTLERIGAERDVSLFLPPDMNEILRSLARGKGESLGREIDVRGAAFYLSIHVMPRLARVRFYAVDITELKRMEEELLAKELKFKVAADFTYDWEYWVDSQDRFVYMSPSCERITSYTREEFVADPEILLNIVHPDDRERVAAHFRDEKLYKDLFEFEYRIIDKMGQERWIGHACRPVIDDAGNPVGCRVSNREITQRRKAESALRDSEERFRVITEMMPSLVFVSRVSDSAILFTNMSFDRTFGYNRGELVGQKAPAILYSPEKWPEVMKELERSGIVLDREMQAKRSDGTPFWVLLSVRKIFFSGEPALLGTSYITVKKRHADGTDRPAKGRDAGKTA